jgi:histidinol-phosphate phosphatase family protein
MTDAAIGSGKPTQAVILAGGLGTRLLPLTADRPKPMVEVNGRPFIDYLIEQLREEGVEEVVLLLGHMASSVERHLGDGERFGIAITYSVTPPEMQTLGRLKTALPMLEPLFLLLYCDNYWPLDLEVLWRRFEEAQAPALVTVYRNLDHQTRDNVRVDSDGFVERFDPSRTDPGLQGVEIGYALLDKHLFEGLDDPQLPFEVALYPKLIRERKLAAHVTDHRYYSIGSYERLARTEAFIAGQPTVILDRDGVLNRKPPQASYVRSWDEFEWITGAKEAIALLTQHGYRLIVVSNQAGIGRGVMSEEDLARVHERMLAEVAESRGAIEAIYHCPHDWNDGCECRKPRPGMLLQAQRDFDLNLSRVVFLGDDERDAQAADAAGCRSLLVSSDKSLLDLARELVSSG